MDTYPATETGPSIESRIAQSTISRFACRILTDRENPAITRIYAAGFDSSRNIFLGVCIYYKKTKKKIYKNIKNQNL